jgi:hemoglobin
MIDKLYESIGGSRTIWAATESFYRRVLNDPDLRPFFETADMKRLQAEQSMFVSMLLGAQVVFTGKNIHSVHADSRARGLNDAHFDAFLGHFRAALYEVGVDPEKADKIIQQLESKRSVILNRETGSQSSAASSSE